MSKKLETECNNQDKVKRGNLKTSKIGNGICKVEQNWNWKLQSRIKA